MGNYEKAQELLDRIPDLIDKKKIGGKDLPTEVFIKKKRTLHMCSTGDTDTDHDALQLRSIGRSNLP